MALICSRIMQRFHWVLLILRVRGRGSGGILVTLQMRSQSQTTGIGKVSTKTCLVFPDFGYVFFKTRILEQEEESFRTVISHMTLQANVPGF